MDTIDNQYIIKEEISDEFSYKYLVEDNTNHKKYIAKVQNLEKEKNIAPYDFESQLKFTKLASDLNNKYLVHLITDGNGKFNFKGKVEENKRYFILDYYPNGQLSEYIEKLEALKELHAKYIFDKILRGVKALHDAGICHRDIKPENILLDENFNPILTNFWISIRFKSESGEIYTLEDCAGTSHYMCPQMKANKPYKGDKADIYSLSILLLYLVNGLEQNKETINIGKFSKEFEELYLKMNSENEDERTTIDEILKYKWFDEIRNEDKNIEKEINNIFSLKRQLLLNEQNTLDYKYNIIKKINNDAYYERYLVKDIESEKQYIAAIRGNIEGIDNNEKYDFNHEVKITEMASELNNPYIIHLENYGTGIFIYKKRLKK